MAERGWKITVDGIYGSQSESVAERFQAEKGLSVDGIVGIQTWNASWDAPVTRS
jgi:peptidoglycan hydrolase-like protein with peptidoglycan-binding domain